MNRGNRWDQARGEFQRRLVPEKTRTAEKDHRRRLAAIQQHVLLPWASAIADASALAHQRLTPAVLRAILEQVPDAWIASGSTTAEERRAQYLAYLTHRLAAAVNFEQEAIRAHQNFV